MRKKTLGAALLLEAALVLTLYSLRAAFAGWFSAVMAFPFEQIGLLLRKLSLAGPAGNGAAWVLYGLLCLLPLPVLALLRRRRKLLAEDAVLGLLCPVLLAVLYLMINPGLLGAWLGETGPAMGKALLGGAVWAMLCAYAVLRVLRRFHAADGPALLRYGRALLWVLAAAFVFAAFGSCFGSLLDSLDSLRAGNTGGGLALTQVFLFLGWLTDGLPYVLDVWVIFAALDLLEAERYSETMTEAADRLAKRCAAALAGTVTVNCVFNLAQLLFARRLRVVSTMVLLPVYAVAFALAALLLARLLRENKALKDDNDLFV